MASVEQVVASNMRPHGRRSARPAAPWSTKGLHHPPPLPPPGHSHVSCRVWQGWGVRGPGVEAGDPADVWQTQAAPGELRGCSWDVRKSSVAFLSCGRNEKGWGTSTKSEEPLELPVLLENMTFKDPIWTGIFADLRKPQKLSKQQGSASPQWHGRCPPAAPTACSGALHGAAAPIFAGFPRFLCAAAAWLNALPGVLRKKAVRNLFLIACLVINRMFQICLFFAHGKLYGHLADVETH